jgi:hypothetical protein
MFKWLTRLFTSDLQDAYKDAYETGKTVGKIEARLDVLIEQTKPRYTVVEAVEADVPKQKQVAGRK